MSNRRRLLLVAGSATTALLIVAVAAWWFLLRSDAPPPVALDDAVAAATTPTTADTTTTTAADDPVATTTGATASIEGTWSVTPGGDSFAGYRVAEELAGIGFTEAAGRTSEVEATLTLADGAVVGVEVTVDMQSLESDDSRRDGRLRTQGIETSTFPTSTFSLTEPIELPAGAADGEPFAVTATGDLTLHGVTRSVEIALEAQLVADTVVVVGSTEVRFDDFDIQKPSAGIVLSIEDTGVIEFQLLFRRP